MEPLWLMDRLAGWGERAACLWRDQSFTYGWLHEQAGAWRAIMAQRGGSPGQLVSIEGGYSPWSCALFLALLDQRHIAVPIVSASPAQRDEFLEIAQVQTRVIFDAQGRWHLQDTERRSRHPLLTQLQASGSPGLVLFTSGSTGHSKAVVHDVGRLLEKFHTPRQCMRTLTFLLFDHIGGMNTLLYTLANGGVIVPVEDRSPAEVCRIIETHRVEMLPTSPTFLNLLLASEEYRRHDLSSLKLVTYGTEPMPATTLQRLTEILPHARLQQTYGLSEVGILRSKSKGSDSLWVKIGGEGIETKVVDRVLWVRSRCAMLGYLNAPSPFDDEGWLNTYDLVEIDGEYLRILGRQTDLINVGGQKVYPAEVENVLLQMAGVHEVTVRGERNPLMGQIVSATVTLSEPEDLEAFKRRLHEHCRGRLARYAIPVRIDIAEQPHAGPRFKKRRAAAEMAG